MFKNICTDNSHSHISLTFPLSTDYGITNAHPFFSSHSVLRLPFVAFDSDSTSYLLLYIRAGRESFTGDPINKRRDLGDGYGRTI